MNNTDDSSTPSRGQMSWRAYYSEEITDPQSGKDRLLEVTPNLVEHERVMVAPSCSSRANTENKSGNFFIRKATVNILDAGAHVTYQWVKLLL